MHIPSDRVRNEMNSEPAAIWYVPANGGKEVAALLKAPTSCIKALIAGCHLNLVFGKREIYLCKGVQIFDIPDTPLNISGIQRYLEEHKTLLRILREREFPFFLFNEMDVCLAWTNANISSTEAESTIDFIGHTSQMYVGPFTNEASYVLDCFCNSFEKEPIYPNSDKINTLSINPILEPWRINPLVFAGLHDNNVIEINEKNEGETFERAIWASLESVFPWAIYKNPKVKIGIKKRELTDIFTFYPYGSFLIEAKDLSILNDGYLRDQAKRTRSVQKQVKKAINQLIGASKAFSRGDIILDDQDKILEVNRDIPPHCIIVITELMNFGNWEEIEDLLIEAMNQTNAIFHLLDLRELITLLKGSSGKAEIFADFLVERCKLFVENKDVFIRVKP